MRNLLDDVLVPRSRGPGLATLIRYVGIENNKAALTRDAPLRGFLIE